MKKFFALLAICLFAFGITATTGIPFGVSFAGVTAASLIKPKQTNLAYSGLNKEIWIPEIKEGFYSEDVWISELKDMSPFVENDIINMAEAGVNPDVLINNTTYPIATAERTDGTIVLELNRFDTTNQHVPHADEVELVYDKRASIAYGHKMALKETVMKYGAHSIAPSADGTYTPIITSTGAVENGFKKLTFSDIRRARTAFNNAKIPSTGRILVLAASHEGDLEDEDLKLYNQMLDKGTLYGFKVYVQADSDMPYYNTTGGAKLAFGGAVTSTHQVASLFFHKDEVMKSDGTIDMFYSDAKNDPQFRRSMLGFSKRNLILPIRNKAIGSIHRTT